MSYDDEQAEAYYQDGLDRGREEWSELATALLALHKNVDGYCHSCGVWAEHEDFAPVAWEEWPCPTVRLLTGSTSTPYPLAEETKK